MPKIMPPKMNTRLEQNLKICLDGAYVKLNYDSDGIFIVLIT